MATDTRNLKTQWQTRLGVSGQVVDGADGLDQFIRAALATQLGSVPHLLDFGIDWENIIDLPIEDALPRLAHGANATFHRWIEPRAKLLRLEPISDGSHLTMRVYYQPADNGSMRMVEVAP